MGRSGGNRVQTREEYLTEKHHAKILAEAKLSPAFQDYVKKTRRTDLSENGYDSHLLTGNDLSRVHYGIGISTEAGEINSLIKGQVFYGDNYSTSDIKHEIGDLLWYVARLLDTEGLNFEECMEANLAKLEKRYPSGFDGTGGKR